MHSRAKKVAAALAAVESFLAEEVHISGGIAAATSAAAGSALSPWAFAGRLAQLNARMGATPRGPRDLGNK